MVGNSALETNLGRFRYHTGAQPVCLDPDEPCPPLFRDLGFEAMAKFLRGDLLRLCGPLSPITYMRTAAYVEPYIDYARIGRVLMLNPNNVQPWHSGIETVYIGPRDIKIDYQTMIFIPSELPLEIAADQLTGVRTYQDAVDVLGVQFFEEAQAETMACLDRLLQTHQETEQFASPLRRRFQSKDPGEREDARAWMLRVGMTESDLCTAWHHLPDERRTFIGHALQEFGREVTC